MEMGSISGISKCIERYPTLANLVDNPYELEGPVYQRLRLVRTHAIDLAREHAIDELGKLHEDLEEMDAETIHKRRQRNQHLLRRLAPGRACINFAVTDARVPPSPPRAGGL